MYVVGPSRDSQGLFIAQQRMNTELRLAGYEPVFIQPDFTFECGVDTALVQKLRQERAAALVELSYSRSRDTFRARLCITRTLHGTPLAVETPYTVRDLGFLTMYVAEALYGAEVSGTAPLPDRFEATPPPAPPAEPVERAAPRAPVAESKIRLHAHSSVLWLSSGGNDLQVEPIGGAALALDASLESLVQAPVVLRLGGAFGFLGGTLTTADYRTRMRVLWLAAGAGVRFDLGHSELTALGQAGVFHAFNPAPDLYPDAEDSVRVTGASVLLLYGVHLAGGFRLEAQAETGTLLPAVRIQSMGQRTGTWGQLLLHAGLGLGYEL